MNGPEHYREAERLVHDYQASLDALSPDLSDAELHLQIEQGATLARLALAAAQVHATLALAAATALADVEFTTRHDRSDWMRVTASERSSAGASS